jgi:hypothetical protein
MIDLDFQPTDEGSAALLLRIPYCNYTPSSSNRVLSLLQDRYRFVI